MLQSFLSTWAAAAMPTSPMLDAFGNPLCITSVDHGDTTPASDDSSFLDCCTFGCNMVSPLLAVGPDNGIGLLRPLSSPDIRFRTVQPFHVQGPEYNPASPRAPPLTA